MDGGGYYKLYVPSSPSAQQCSNTMRSVGADSVITHVHGLYITTLHLTAVTVVTSVPPVLSQHHH